MTGTLPAAVPGPGRRVVAPLYAAGFTTAFGAHAIAANLGGYTRGRHDSLLVLGVLLALYDGAEVLLKPVFGALADRVGPRPVLLGGLAAFAVFSAAFVAAGDPALVAVTRFGQGAAAAAFSPAASALVARLNPQARQGRAFGGYGMYKSLGYGAGPLIGGALVTVGGLTALFAALAGLAAAVTIWAAVTVPAAAPQPRTRQTVLDLARRLSSRGFLVPTACLAGTTAALAAGVGFLPVRGAATGLGPLATGAVVSLLAATTAVVQPFAGRARDAGRPPTVPAWLSASPWPQPGWRPPRCCLAWPGSCQRHCLPGPASAPRPRSPSPPSPPPPRPAASGRPWAPPKSDANSATPAAPSSSPPRRARPPCPAACSSSPDYSPPPQPASPAPAAGATSHHLRHRTFTAPRQNRAASGSKSPRASAASGSRAAAGASRVPSLPTPVGVQGPPANWKRMCRSRASSAVDSMATPSTANAAASSSGRVRHLAGSLPPLPIPRA